MICQHCQKELARGETHRLSYRVDFRPAYTCQDQFCTRGTTMGERVIPDLVRHFFKLGSAPRSALSRKDVERMAETIHGVVEKYGAASAHTDLVVRHEITKALGGK